MGYSGRYHAASLVAVFIALAIGILIGVGLADEVVSTASQEVEESLRGDLAEAREDLVQRGRELERANELGEATYSVLVDERLAGSRIAVLGIGELPTETVREIQEALVPTGAEVRSIAAIGLPPDPEELADQAPGRFREMRRDDRALADLGRALGRQLPDGGPLIERLRGPLFSQFSGSLGEIELVVLLGRAPEPEQGDAGQGEDEEADGGGAADAFVDGLIEGLRRSTDALVAVERTASEPTTLDRFSTAGIATADHVDLTSGKLAMVLGLLGAEGDFGVKDRADALLPELDPLDGD